MRLSNIILISSTVIVLTTAICVLTYQAYQPGGTSDSVSKDTGSGNDDGSSSPSNDRGNPDSEMETVESLKADLMKSKKLLEANNDQIFQLNEEIRQQAETINRLEAVQTQVQGLLNCSAEDLLVRVRFLMDSHSQIRGRLQAAYSQMNQLRQDAVVDGESPYPKAGSELANAEKQPGQRDPLIKPMGLFGPDNGKEVPTRVDPALRTPTSNAQTVDVSNPRDAEANGSGTNSVNNAEGPGEAVLLARIQQLQVELKNREKLLMEQTSLIEDLKQKSSRVETTFRTNEDSPPAGRPVPAFLDRGTFKVLKQ